MMAAEGDDMEQLLIEVEEASKMPAQRRGGGVKSSVEKLTCASYERGLLPNELDRLVDVITSRNFLDQASLGAIVRNLYPASRVSGANVLKVVGCLGHGQLKASLVMQNQLLRWIIMVYHVLDDSSALSQTYSVLFNLLDTAALRACLCQLLALITRRRHVRHHRIQALLNRCRQTGGDASLIGLLRVFKSYYAEIVVGDAIRGRAATFKHPDAQWKERLDQIQHNHQSQLREGDAGSRNGFTVATVAGRRRKAVIPAVKTLHAQESSVTLEEIDSAEALVHNLEKIQLPNQLVACLGDALLQKLMVLRPDVDADERVRNWLLACVHDVSSGDAGPSLLLDIVDVVLDYVAQSKTCQPPMLAFLSHVLETWNGQDRRASVLGCLVFAPLGVFKDLYQSIFRPLERAMLDNTADSQLQLLGFYTSLLQRWSIQVQVAEDPCSLPLTSIADLVDHVSKLCLTLTQTSASVSTHLAILDFYDTFVAMLSNAAMIRCIEVVIPPPLMVYTLHFSHSLVVTSRLYAILASYKRVLETIKPPPPRDMTDREKNDMRAFNGFLMDICNCAWRDRAFKRTDNNDVNSQRCLVPESTVAMIKQYAERVDPGLLKPETLFGLSCSPALCLQSIRFVRDLEDADADMGGGNQIEARQAGPVTRASLLGLRNRGGLDLGWNAYRSGVLDWLENMGIGGLKALMDSTMKNRKK